MVASHITSDPRSGKLMTLNKDNDDDDNNDNDKLLNMFIYQPCIKYT